MTEFERTVDLTRLSLTEIKVLICYLVRGPPNLHAGYFFFKYCTVNATFGTVDYCKHYFWITVLLFSVKLKT